MAQQNIETEKVAPASFKRDSQPCRVSNAFKWLIYAAQGCAWEKREFDPQGMAGKYFIAGSVDFCRPGFEEKL